MTRTLVACLAVVGLIGCTTLSPLPDAQPATIRQSVEAGDRVEIQRMDGTRQRLKIESVGADALTGTHEGKRYQVPLADIRSIGTVGMSTSAKIWTTVGIVAAIGVAAAADGGGGGGGDGY